MSKPMERRDRGLILLHLRDFPEGAGAELEKNLNS